MGLWVVRAVHENVVNNYQNKEHTSMFVHVTNGESIDLFSECLK